MKEKLKIVISGDPMIKSEGFVDAWKKYFPEFDEINAKDWEEDYQKLQFRRLEVEKEGPEIETVPEIVKEKGKEANVLAGLFVPVSKKLMDSMPELRIVGLSRAGLENINLEEATKRGILVFNVMGRNAHAVSDFTIAMMMAEMRNIARSHHSIKKGIWQKEFANDDNIMEMRDKTIGIVGFGHIGSLIAKKLSGFDVKVKTYDPYLKPEIIEGTKVEQVELEELLKTSDIISLNARLTEENRHMISEKEFDLMKETALFVNTGRAGLVDEKALLKALEEKKIQGAALDVFSVEPIGEDSPFLDLDNVTLTSHIAGTTSDALNNSPYMLFEDISSFVRNGEANFIVNPEVLENEDFSKWIESIRESL